MQLVDTYGAKKWKLMSAELNRILHRSQFIKDGKHCRERWVNHLNPDLVKGNWTDEEDLTILETQYLKGNKWSTISKKLNGRNEN